MKGVGGSEDLVKGAEIMKRVAGQGYSLAQYFYAKCLIDGLGVKVDLANARKYLKMAADQGHVEASNEYGVALMKGRGGKVNETEGIKYLKIAAEHGHMEATFQLGWAMIEKNDFVHGCHYVRVAANGGFAKASEVLKSVVCAGNRDNL
jgi:TPR repeat protein